MTGADGHSMLTTWPSVAPAAHFRTIPSTLSRTARTDPSPMHVMTVPLWKLNGSSLAPQLLTVQRHSAGPGARP